MPRRTRSSMRWPWGTAGAPPPRPGRPSPFRKAPPRSPPLPPHPAPPAPRPPQAPAAASSAPARAPDVTIEIATLPQAALIYRLSADLNPLHADPAVARAAGFDRPILHGLGTYGVAARALVAACCDNDPTR